MLQMTVGACVRVYRDISGGRDVDLSKRVCSVRVSTREEWKEKEKRSVVKERWIEIHMRTYISYKMRGVKI